MKKAFLVLAVILISIASRASLKVYNNTCGTVTFSIACHDATYPNCDDIHSQNFVLLAGTSMTFNNTQSLGYCYVSPYISPTYVPAVTQNFEECYFSGNDGAGGIVNDAIGLCGAISSTSTPPGIYCGGTGNFVASMYKVGANTEIMFNPF